ncbi:MAG: hypothetical protein KME60_24010 [Cyanomargarita calcarea GSE-NOS-MK-12-04C]|jgi:hypothetical protein|uniref:Lipoprotein n=1 Tax=Cyanomargarita calcarea GSE-NOS-MK-12-04C TaxID=2839659 RepID=A0A951QQT3_9CYAN|nr:hypothetical protein [Cyanomargarita calcarea GSE-NOS-MK-12-04C]
MKLYSRTVLLALIAFVSGCSKKIDAIFPSPTAIQVVDPEPAKSITSNWYGYISKDDSYSAKFPAHPQEFNQSTDSPIGKLNVALVFSEDKTSGRAYLIQSNKYPVESSNFDIERGLTGARDRIAQTYNGSVTGERNISYNGYPGREITLRTQSSVAFKVRIFIDSKGPTLYQAVVTAQDGDLDFVQTTAFLDSFNIK